MHAGDGLALVSTRVAAAVRCAPPANKPTPAERDACAPFLDTELGLLAPHLRVVVALGSSLAAYGMLAVLGEHVSILGIAVSFALLPWEVVLISAGGAVVLNLVLAMNHRPGRYIGH